MPADVHSHASGDSGGAPGGRGGPGGEGGGEGGSGGNGAYSWESSAHVDHSHGECQPASPTSLHAPSYHNPQYSVYIVLRSSDSLIRTSMPVHRGVRMHAWAHSPTTVCIGVEWSKDGQ